MIKAKVRYAQSLFDIAFQFTGSIEGIVEIAILNNISVTDELSSGQTILIPKDSIKDQEILNYYNMKRIKPATGLTKDSGLIEDGLVGIAYWGINVDFVVS